MLSLQRLVGFSERYRLRIKRDDCGDSIVPGKFGHLYEHDVHRLGMVLEALSDNARWHKTLRARRRRAIATGFVLHQGGDCEAILLFDPSDTEQAKLAVRLIQAKKIKRAPRPTDARLRARALFSSKVRSKRPCSDQNANAIDGQGVEMPRSRAIPPDSQDLRTPQKVRGTDE